MSQKILIIEDEEFIAEMYKIKFEQEGYTVLIGADGLAGIALAKAEQPDLILLDLIMPRMDGYEVLTELKKDSTTANIKTYILSNLVQNDEVKKGFAIGASGYLVKASLTPAELVENVRKIFLNQEVGLKEPANSGSRHQAPSALAPDGQAQAQDNRPEILLIEDEDSIIDIYTTKLNQEGYAVSSAKNGAWGLKMAKEKAFALILLDMHMPAMNGFSALSQLKDSGGASASTPVIIISNSGQDDEITAAKDAGAVDFLIKSLITPSQLTQRVNQILRPS